MADPIDRMIEILDGFEVEGDQLGTGLRHTVCGVNVASTGIYPSLGHSASRLDDDRLGVFVRGAIMHAAECPGPAVAEPVERKPCGDVHAGPCEVLDREDTSEGAWLTVRHEDGDQRVFLGEIA
jgi:hypothetical protein